MFTAVTSSSSEIKLFSLKNVLVAATGPDFAFAKWGRLETPQRATVLGSSDTVTGPAMAPTVPLDFVNMYGTWPDSTWATVNLGWKAEGRGPGYPVCTVPDHAIVRWDEASKAWIKQLDLNWIEKWPGGVLAGSLDGKFRWADGSSTPVPAMLTEGVIGNGWSAPMPPCTTNEGDIYINFSQSPKYEPGWWVFPRGRAEGEKVVMPPGMASHRGWLSSSVQPGVLYVSGTLESDEPYLGVRVQGTWQQLPPPLQGQPDARFDMSLFESSSGWLVASVRIHSTDETIYYKLSPGSGWRPLSLKSPFVSKEVDRRMLVVGKDDDLWLSARFQGQNRSVLYYARL